MKKSTQSSTKQPQTQPNAQGGKPGGGNGRAMTEKGAMRREGEGVCEKQPKVVCIIEQSGLPVWMQQGCVMTMYILSKFPSFVDCYYMCFNRYDDIVTERP